MDNNGNDTKNTRKFSIRMNFVGKGEEFKLQKTVLHEGGLQLAYIRTNNVREYELNTRLVYAMLILDN